MIGSKWIAGTALALGAAAMGATALHAKDDKALPLPPQVYKLLIECRTLADPAALGAPFAGCLAWNDPCERSGC